MKPLLPLVVVFLPALLIGVPARSDDGPIRIGPLISQPGTSAVDESKARVLRRGAVLLPAEIHLLAPLTAAERERLVSPADEDGRRGRVAIGIVREVAPFGVRLRVDRDFAGAVTEGGGRLERLDDGRLVWTTAVVSPGAGGIRLMLEGSLPQDAVAFVYSAEGEVHGPYVSSQRDFANGFWTNTVFSDEIFLEVQLPAASSLGATLSIASVGHRLPDGPRSEAGPAPVTESTLCEVDESCVASTEWANVDQASKAVAELDFFEQGTEFLCSGGLLNDTASDATPYLLTAHHCFSTQASASSLEAFFQYHTASCNGADPGRQRFPRTAGSTLLATSAVSDFTFVQLAENPPAGSVFLGWSRADYSQSDGTSLYRLSHPQGHPQVYTRETVDGNPASSGHSCPTVPQGNFIYSQDTVGATDGGSSGSPLMLEDLTVVGQLFGACGDNVNNACAGQPPSPSFDAVDGAFDKTYASVAEWLAPTTCLEATISTEPGNETIASGQSTTLLVSATGVGTLTYQWYQGETGDTSHPIVSTNGNSFRTPALTSTTSYWVSVSNSCGSTDSTTATVTVSAPCTPPSIRTQPASQMVMMNSATTLEVTAAGTGPFSYQWYIGSTGNTSNPVAGATSSSYRTLILTSISSFWVKVTNSCGSVASATATISISSGCMTPSVTIPPASQTVLSGSTATLSVVLSGTAPLSYQWYQNTDDGPVAVQGATDAGFTTPPVASAESYYVAVRNICGAVKSESAIISPCDPPTLTSPPVDQSVTVGAQAVLSFAATGTPPFSYSWFDQNGATADLVGSGPSLSVTATSNPQSFYVQVSDACGSVTSQTVTVTGVPCEPPVITTSPADQGVPAGSIALLSVEVSGSGPFEYQWFQGDAGDISNPVGTESTLPVTPSQDPRNFWVLVSNPCGASESAAATVSLQQPPRRRAVHP